MNIRLYSFKLLTRWEFFQMLAEALKVFESNQAEMPQSYTDKVAELRTAFEIYDKELVQERTLTPQQLFRAEERRDYAVRKIYQLIRYYSDYRFSQEKERAAKALMRIFKSYGTGSKISRQGQDAKTAIITNLLQELSGDTAPQHIATLQLTDAVEALETNNLVFKREQQRRRKLQAEFVKGVARSARTEVQNQFMKLVTLVNALAVVEGEEKYAELKQLLTTIVQKYLTQARQRTKGREVEE